MSIDHMENDLINAAQIIGSILEANNHYTHQLAKRIESTGKAVADLTLAELIAINTACKCLTNNTDGNGSPISLDDLLQKQEQERCFKYLPLESELLLRRVKDRGHSGEFLAHAFISSYRTNTPFEHSLGEIMKLDTEAIRLFHQIIHLRFIKGWSDSALYELEQKIIELNGVAA